jgi:hypothetical protein
MCFFWNWHKLSSLPEFCPRFEIGGGQFLSNSLVGDNSVPVSCVFILMGWGHRGCSADGGKFVRIIAVPAPF